MDKLSVLGDIGPPARSAYKRDPILEFDDRVLPDNDRIEVRGSRLHATDAPEPRSLCEQLVCAPPAG